MRLAWRNLVHDRIRFLVTIAGIAFAVFLMIFQGSLLTGFLRAASKAIDLTDAQVWIAARGVDCFEFPTPLPSRFKEMSMGVTGVESVYRITTGLAVWRKPSGREQLVQLVGADPGIGSRFPLPYLNPGRDAILTESVLVDASNSSALEVNSVPSSLELTRARAHVVGIIDEFGSFFGTPYVLTSYVDAAHYLHIPREETSFFVVRVSTGYDVEKVRRELQERLPEADVRTRQEFSSHSRTFWVLKTGAGGAILTAAFLGFLVGLVVVSQNMYATTVDNIEEYATLKAMGATKRYIQSVVITQALVSGIIGSLIGLVATYPATQAAQGSIAWIYTPWWLPVVTIGMGLLMCGIASLVSIRKAVSVEPARVFRA
jgi:putative ABC transport system permease protein